tara:strand:- start:118 stop:447 length:330 start_codon:yes stop_codon:yes gene_type:complete
MNRFVKVILISAAVLFVGIVSYLNYQTYFSAAAQKGKMNIENLKKIKVNMSEGIVVKVMGTPDEIIHPIGNGEGVQYLYKTNDESFANVRVIFDSNMVVKDTYLPKSLE